MGIRNSFTLRFPRMLGWFNMDIVKEIEKHENVWNEFYHKYSGYVATVGFLGSKGFAVNNNTACHASLNYPNKEVGDILAVVSGLQSHGFSKEEEKIFVNYMLNESHWSRCFLNPSVKHVMEKRYWIGNPDVESNFLTNAMVATRLISEFPNRFKVFLAAMEEGLTGNEAYLLSMVLNINSDKFVWQVSSGHSPINGGNAKQLMKSFLIEGPVKARMGGVYKEVRGYRGLTSVWSGADSYESKGWDMFYAIVPAQEKVMKNLNIFYKPPKHERGYLYSKSDLKHLIEKIKEKIVA